MFEVWRDGACHPFETRRQLDSFVVVGDLVDVTYPDGRRETTEAIEWGDPSWPLAWRKTTLRPLQEA